MSEASPATSPATWPEILATSLVGTARSGARAEEVLEAAAAQGLRRRAGVALVHGVRPPQAAPGDDAPRVGRAAAVRADALLALDRPAREATPAGDMAGRIELLAEWLMAAAAAGRRLPPELVPALLDAARRHRELRPMVAAVGGPLAGWLARQRPGWGYASQAPPAETGVADDANDADDADDTVWELGSIGQRAAYLGRLRQHDPARARELLAAAWDLEPPEDRATLLGALGTGLASEDEPMLERALDDRRRQVRAVALELLGRLPGSGYARRMAGRAAACVDTSGPDRIVISPPTACDRSMVRDGIAPEPPAGIGERAWWLEEILARTQLSHWPDPAVLLARRIGDEWVAAVRRGLARAAANQRDAAWASVLVDLVSAAVVAGGRQDDRRLLETLYQALPPEDLAAQASAILERGLTAVTPVTADQVLALCPAPWPPALADAVFRAITDQLGKPAGGARLTGLCELAALRMPASFAPRAAALREQLRAAGQNHPARPAIARLAATLRFRHDMLEELA